MSASVWGPSARTGPLFSVILLIESKQHLMDSSALLLFSKKGKKQQLAFKGRRESAESTEDANWL